MVKSPRPPSVGLLALQGDFAKHTSMLTTLGASTLEIRRAGQLAEIDALIIPGGESTTMTKLMTDDLRGALVSFAKSHPVWGTCAGMIMLSSNAQDYRVQPLGLIDIEVERMGFGRQVWSFEAPLKLAEVFPESARAFNGFFIRAPRVKRHAHDVEELAWLETEPVALRKGNLLLTSFHPELTDDNRFHAYFLSMLG